MAEITCKEAGSRQRSGGFPGLQMARAAVVGAVAGALLGFALGGCLPSMVTGPSFWESCKWAVLGAIPGATFGAAVTTLAVAPWYAVVIGLSALWDLMLAVFRLAGALVGRLR
jgi:hypothetical protein